MKKDGINTELNNSDKKLSEQNTPKLHQDEEGLFLAWKDMVLRADFKKMVPRLNKNNLSKELLVKAASPNKCPNLTAIDATGGLGEDALLLAAAGFSVKVYERNPVIYNLLEDAIFSGRVSEDAALNDAANRMTAINQDSIDALQNLREAPDVIFLDPMFPEKQKNSLTKKKLQLFQKIVPPCNDEEELLKAAISAKPKRIIIKRPLKGPYLGGIKPTFSHSGKTLRIDCIILSNT